MADSQQSSVPIRVLLVDDETLLRQGLRSALETYPNIQVVGEAKDGEEAILITGNLRPAVIVMDINMPKLDGIETTRLIKANNPEIVVVGFSSALQDSQAYAMQKAGAFEVYDKQMSVTELYSAIQRGVAAVKPVLILEEKSLKESDVEAEKREPLSKEEHT
jgi:DNA-binding NarL/FixJ family response regulator